MGGTNGRRGRDDLRDNAQVTSLPAASATAAPPSTPSAWDRYRPWRGLVEAGYWVALYVIGAIANSITVLMDVSRLGLGFAAWKPVVWETTSSLAALALVPAVVWFTRRVPLHVDTWRRALPLYLLASVAWSALHVAGMVLLRKAIYATHGEVYGFSPWWWEFGYEYLKDVRSFAGIVVTIEVYRFVLRRLQGEASLLAPADDAPEPATPARPERFLVRKLGKEFLINAADVEWLQASGNYVNLHVRGRDYPLRATMAGIEKALDPARFARVHRSYIANLDCIVEIEPTDSGDARLVMGDGSELPCSRRYRDALRPRAGGASSAC